MKQIGRIQQVVDRMVDGCATAAILILIFVWVSICFNVGMRYLLDKPQIWVLELCEYSILYMTFLGAAWLHKKDGHVKVDWLVGLLPEKATDFLNMVTSYLGFMLFLIITWYGIETVYSHFVRGTYRITLLETPMYLILSVIPVGSFLLALQFLYCGREHWNRWRRHQNGAAELMRRTPVESHRR